MNRRRARLRRHHHALLRAADILRELGYHDTARQCCECAGRVAAELDGSRGPRIDPEYPL